jgi:hypothetical protein
MAGRRHRRCVLIRTPDAGPFAWAFEGDIQNLLAGTAPRRALGF